MLGLYFTKHGTKNGSQIFLLFKVIIKLYCEGSRARLRK